MIVGSLTLVEAMLMIDVGVIHLVTFTMKKLKQSNPRSEMSKDIELYDITMKSKIYISCSDKSKYVIFDHLDGMYSFCLSEKGNPVHLSASIPLVAYKDGYKIKDIPPKKDVVIGEVKWGENWSGNQSFNEGLDKAIKIIKQQ